MKRLSAALLTSTIVVDEPALQKGFTVVPNYLFGLKNLSHGARLTYVLLLKYAWQEGSCFPGLETLAQLLEVERKSVIRYNQELVDRGLVTVERRGQGKTNVYHINRWGHPPVPAPVVASLPIDIQTRSPIHGTSESPPDGTSRSPLHGTLIRPSLQLPNHKSADAHIAFLGKPPAHVQYLVDEILQVTKDPQSTSFYRQAAMRFADDLIFQWLSEIKHDSTISNRGAVFTSKLRAWQQKHGQSTLTQP